jgi:hypothetical protein
MLVNRRQASQRQSPRRRHKTRNWAKASLGMPYDTMPANRRRVPRRLSSRGRYKIRHKAKTILGMSYNRTPTNRRRSSRGGQLSKFLFHARRRDPYLPDADINRRMKRRRALFHVVCNVLIVCKFVSLHSVNMPNPTAFIFNNSV